MRANSGLWNVLCVLVSGLRFAGLWSGGHHWGDDFASYIMQAMSVVNGTAAEFVKQNAFTINESSRQLGPVAYPWGFPLLLAPVYAIFGFDLTAFKLVGPVFYVLFLLTIWLGFRRTLGPMELLVFLSLFSFNPAMLAFGDQVLADIPFLFFSTLSIVMIRRLFLVCCPADSHAKSLRLGKDRSGGASPDERLAIDIVVGDEVIDPLNQLAHRAERAGKNLIVVARATT